MPEKKEENMTSKFIEQACELLSNNPSFHKIKIEGEKTNIIIDKSTTDKNGNAE